MQIALQNEILKRTQRYLNGKISAAELETWLLPATRNVHQSGNTQAEQLAGAVELRLAEFDRGHWTEPELRIKLEGILSDYQRMARHPRRSTRSLASD